MTGPSPPAERRCRSHPSGAPQARVRAVGERLDGGGGQHTRFGPPRRLARTRTLVAPRSSPPDEPAASAPNAGGAQEAALRAASHAAVPSRRYAASSLTTPPHLRFVE